MGSKNMVGKVAVLAGCMALVAGLAFSSGGGGGVSPDEALQKLMDGNKRYVENKMTGAERCNASSREALAATQKPYAVVLTCSDSRVPPEIIFDKGLGEIFVIRVAGNVPDPVVIGSIEYSVEHLGSPLVMVLGHERCGAIKATVDSKGKSTGSPNIDAIVKLVEPSAKAAVSTCAACKGEKSCADTKKSEFVECVVETNAVAVAGQLTQRSKILKHMADEKKIKIVAAKYDLDDGIVTLLK